MVLIYSNRFCTNGNLKPFAWLSYLFILIVIFIPNRILSQELDQVRSRFPHSDAVLLNHSNHYSIINNNGNLKIVNQVNETEAYLTANDLRTDNNDVYFSSFSVIKDIKAYTESLTGKNREVRKLQVRNFETKSVLDQSFYDDYKKIDFTFAGITKDAITHLDYNEECLEPHFIGCFMFSTSIPVVQSELSITVPNNVRLAYTLFGDDTSIIKFTSTLSGKNTTYIWSAKNVTAEKPEIHAPAMRYYAPHIIFRISSYEADGQQVNLLDGPETLYKWYKSLEKDLNKTDERELKNLVLKITAGIKNDRDKAKAIYQWVQGNINYIAFEDGWGGFVPRDAAKVCANKYGDCKDMANMLSQMLKYAGLDAGMAWIGTRHLPYTYEQVPTPLVDNHVITALRLDGKTIFLDGTHKYLPFGLPSPFIQGKETMVGINDKEFKLITVPEVEKEINKIVDSTVITINGRDVEGVGHVHYEGFQKLTFDYAYYGARAKNDKDFFESYLSKGNNKFILKSQQVTGLSDPDKDIDVTYQYSIPDLIKSSTNKLYINMNLNKPLKDEQLDIDKRKHAREFEYKFVNEYKVVLPVPAGYAVEYMPEEATFDGKNYGFTINYRRQGDKIIQDKKVYINTLMLNKTDFKDWNDFIGRLNNAYRETVVLAKTQP